MGWNPDVTVAAVVERDGRFLVVEELVGSDLVINQPAGHVEPGESLLEAVIRETREETAWSFVPAAFLGAYAWRSPISGRWMLRFAFVGSVRDFDPEQALDPDIVRTHWLGAAELRGHETRLRSPVVMQCVEDYLSGRRLPLEAVAAVDSGHAGPGAAPGS